MEKTNMSYERIYYEKNHDLNFIITIIYYVTALIMGTQYKPLFLCLILLPPVSVGERAATQHPAEAPIRLGASAGSPSSKKHL